jgi:hypothetical protein
MSLIFNLIAWLLGCVVLVIPLNMLRDKFEEDIDIREHLSNQIGESDKEGTYWGLFAGWILNLPYPTLVRVTILLIVVIYILLVCFALVMGLGIVFGGYFFGGEERFGPIAFLQKWASVMLSFINS